MSYPFNDGDTFMYKYVTFKKVGKFIVVDGQCREYRDRYQSNPAVWSFPKCYQERIYDYVNGNRAPWLKAMQ